MNLRRVTFVCLAAGVGGVGAVTGCSSSSSNGAPTDTMGADANTTANVDAGSDAGVALQWAVDDLTGSYYVAEAGIVSASDAGGGNGTIADAGPADGGVAEDGASADGGDAGVTGETTITPGDASVADATVAAGDASDDGGGFNPPPLQGVQVCIYQNSAIPCATSGADGTFTLNGLPVRSDVVLALTKSGYQSILLPISTASTDMDGRSNPLYMNPTAAPPVLGAAIDQQTKGSINAFAVQLAGSSTTALDPVPGTSVALSPSSGLGPYYVADSTFAIDLTATAFSGVTALYYNVDPGTYTLTFTNSAYDCEPISFPFGQFGFPVTTPPHSTKIVVAAGYVTGIVGVLCTANAAVVAVDGG